jgi:hypothetical protein
MVIIENGMMVPLVSMKTQKVQVINYGWELFLFIYMKYKIKVKMFWYF